MQLTGVYDLVAVLTHKGRSADSGHYVAWVKQESGKLFSKSITQIKNVKKRVILEYNDAVLFSS